MKNRKWFFSLSAIVLSTSIIASGCFGGDEEQEESNTVESNIVQKAKQETNKKAEKNPKENPKSSNVAKKKVDSGPSGDLEDKKEIQAVINHAYPNISQEQEVKQVITFAKEDPIKSNIDSEIKQAVAFSESVPVMTVAEEEEIEYVIDYSIPDDNTDDKSNKDLEISIDSAKQTLASIEKEMIQKTDNDDEADVFEETDQTIIAVRNETESLEPYVTTPTYQPIEEELVYSPELPQEDYEVQPVNELVQIKEPTEAPVESMPTVEQVEKPIDKVAGASETTDDEAESNEIVDSTEDQEQPIEEFIEEVDEFTEPTGTESESDEETEDNQSNENEASSDSNEPENDEINEVENTIELSIIEPDEPITQEEIEEADELILQTSEFEISIVPEHIEVESIDIQIDENDLIHSENNESSSEELNQDIENHIQQPELEIVIAEETNEENIDV